MRELDNHMLDYIEKEEVGYYVTLKDFKLFFKNEVVYEEDLICYVAVNEDEVLVIENEIDKLEIEYDEYEYYIELRF